MSRANPTNSFIAIVIFYAVTMLPSDTIAHCDTYNGPVVIEAKIALEKGDVTSLLKWVRKDDEGQIKTAFQKVLAVRKKSPEVKELADQYFFETLVRIHRAGEGAPFTGLKSTPSDPIEVMADKTLESGNPDTLITKITGHIRKEINAKFQSVIEAKKHQNESVNAGREYVEAYVTYLHYVGGIHKAISNNVEHHQSGENKEVDSQKHKHE